MHDSKEIADIHEDYDFDLQLMPDDDLRSVAGFHTTDSNDTHKNEVSKSDHIFQDDNASTERLSLPDHMDHIWEPPSAQVVLNEKSMVVQNPKEKKEETISMEDDSDDDDLEKQPLSKRFKIMTPIPNPIPLNTFVPKHLLKPKEQQKSLHDFTNQLFGTTSSKFSPTPPREPTPPKDPAKGKELNIVKEQVNELVTYQEQGCSILKMPKLKPFITPEGTLSQEQLDNQIKELKRISDLKAQKDKYEQELRKMFNQDTLKAQAKKWTEHKANKAKILEEYNHQISFRADPLPITKSSYTVNSNKKATMKIIRGDNPVNLIVHPNFRLKSLGSSEWLEVNA
uniref:Uncharacterized protein n=1 Tax=Tanacetum cinerariifolium TaxID=118510 RepID=A0A6L2KT82_TANCI|nr:hypothetical protein [Tanacetum cinerariifolium]